MQDLQNRFIKVERTVHVLFVIPSYSVSCCFVLKCDATGVSESMLLSNRCTWYAPLLALVHVVLGPTVPCFIHSTRNQVFGHGKVQGVRTVSNSTRPNSLDVPDDSRFHDTYSTAMQTYMPLYYERTMISWLMSYIYIYILEVRRRLHPRREPCVAHSSL